MARVQMEMSEKSFERLKILKEKVEASSYADVMRDALRLLEFVVNEENAGSEFYVKKINGEISNIKII